MNRDTGNGEDRNTAADGLRAAMWHQVAGVLYAELKKHGWGDFHYGDQGQAEAVVDALAVYERASTLDEEDLIPFEDVIARLGFTREELDDPDNHGKDQA